MTISYIYNFDTGMLDAIDVATQNKFITFNVGNGSNFIVAGTTGYIKVPFSANINSWYLTEVSALPLSGTIVLDIWKDTTANYPPTSGDSIAGSEKPTLTNQTNGSNVNLTTWTKQINNGDYLGFYVSGITDCKKVILQLGVTI